MHSQHIPAVLKNRHSILSYSWKGLFISIASVCAMNAFVSAFILHAANVFTRAKKRFNLLKSVLLIASLSYSIYSWVHLQTAITLMAAE